MEQGYGKHEYYSYQSCLIVPTTRQNPTLEVGTEADCIYPVHVFCTYPRLIVRDIIWLFHPKTSMPFLLNRQTFPRMPGPFQADQRGEAARQLCYQSSFDWGGYLEIR